MPNDFIKWLLGLPIAVIGVIFAALTCILKILIKAQHEAEGKRRRR
jgi:hypothetical protein